MNSKKINGYELWELRPNIFKNLTERSKFKMLLYCLWKDYNYCKKHNEYWNLQCRYYDTWYTNS